jgi:LacI family transcriptional regulator
VANLAGVSRSSVSLVLNGRGDGNLRADKQVAILEAARKLNYRPNAVALSLRSQRTWTLGVLTWQGASGFPQEMLHSTLETASAAGYLTLFMDTPDGLDQDDRAVTALLDRQVDGIMVVAPELAEYPVRELLGPVQKILINCVDPQHAVTSIVPDEFAGAACATQILIDRGHTRIVLLTDAGSSIQVHDRTAGVHQALSDADLAAPRVYTAGVTVRAGFDLARQALRADPRPTAIICARERLTLGALLAARDLGLEVPADVSLISLDDAEGLTSDLVPEIATVQRPDRAMAKQAVAILLREVDSKGDHDVRQLSFACPASLGASIAEVGSSSSSP